MVLVFCREGTSIVQPPLGLSQRLVLSLKTPTSKGVSRAMIVGYLSFILTLLVAGIVTDLMSWAFLFGLVSLSVLYFFLYIILTYLLRRLHHGMD
jgi:hypothetical protein